MIIASTSVSNIVRRLSSLYGTVPFCGPTFTGNIASVAPGTPCINTAHNGATRGSFVADGCVVSRRHKCDLPLNDVISFWNIFLAAIRGEVTKGRRTLVTIQFGHNDTKIAPPESRGPIRRLWCNKFEPSEPVVVTSLTRRAFNANGTIQEALAPWAIETILISRQQKTHHSICMPLLSNMSDPHIPFLNG